MRSGGIWIGWDLFNTLGWTAIRLSVKIEKFENWLNFNKISTLYVWRYLTKLAWQKVFGLIFLHVNFLHNPYNNAMSSWKLILDLCYELYPPLPPCWIGPTQPLLYMLYGDPVLKHYAFIHKYGDICHSIRFEDRVRHVSSFSFLCHVNSCGMAQ